MSHVLLRGVTLVCRVCLVRHLESSSSCPICGRPVYLRPRGQSKETNVRSDQVLQDLVYKLVPQLFASESSSDVYIQRSLLY